MRIAFITYQDNGTYFVPNIENEDDRLLGFLEKKGLNVDKVIWNDVKVDWAQYAFAVLKSPWDYVDSIDDFYSWLAWINDKNIPLLNPASVVKWNADKHYLRDIENAGLKVTPSIYIENGNKTNFTDYFEIFNAEKFIVKPCVSGGSKNTFKVTRENIAELSIKINELLKKEDFIIQPFLTEIEEEGEWSFVFFNGKFSHSILKKAKKGDFRVQHSFGGTVHVQNPSADLITQVQPYVDQFGKDCLYTRVDGVFVENEFLLIELELIEPYLFLDTNESSYENYYQALKALLYGD